MSDVTVKLSEQSAAAVHSLVQHFRTNLKDITEQEESWLREAELALAGGLRALGWMPRDGGGWEQHGPAHWPLRRRF